MKRSHAMTLTFDLIVLFHSNSLYCYCGGTQDFFLKISEILIDCNGCYGAGSKETKTPSLNTVSGDTTAFLVKINGRF